MEYETSEEWGPFGECATTIDYEYTPCPSGDAGKVTVTGGWFYDIDKKWIAFGQETALNVHSDIEEEIREWHEEQLAMEAQEAEWAGGYKG
jgi:hypothetical protein